MLRLSLAALSGIVLLVPAMGTAGTIVVPNAQTNSAGDLGGSGGPTAPSAGIYQELFGADQFPGEIAITGLSLRAFPGAGALGWPLGDLTLYLSTSSKLPDGTGPALMSSTFADNIGPDNTLVFSATNFSLTAPGCTGPGACPFGATLNFSTPFDYNPANGSLLAEFVFTGLNPVSGQIDAQFFSAPGGSIAQVVAWGSTTAASGQLDYAGNVTQFTFTSVPEPASWTLLAAGATALFWMARRRRALSRAPWTPAG